MSHSPTDAFNADDDSILALAPITAHFERLATDLLLVPYASEDHIDYLIARQAAICAGFKRIYLHEKLAGVARLPEEAPSERAHSLQLDLSSWTITYLTAALCRAECAKVYRIQIDRQSADKISGFSQRYAQGERSWIRPKAARSLGLQRALALQ